MPTPTRLILLSAAILVAAIATLTVATAGSRASASTCSASQLTGKKLDSSGAAGTILISITLRNNGSACELKGYPALRIANALGLLPTRVVHGGLAILNDKPKQVKLAHAGKATILISFGDVPVGGETRCPAGTKLRLGPPGASGWLTIKVETEACGHGTLHESPVLAGVHSSR
jgi:hypothetical protein